MNNLVIANDNIFISANSYKYGVERYSPTIKGKSKPLTNIGLKAIPEISKYSALKADVFPNPARPFSTVVFSGNLDDVGVTVTDIAGRMVWKKRFRNITRIDLPHKMASGVYTVTVDNRVEVKTIKLIRK